MSTCLIHSCTLYSVGKREIKSLAVKCDIVERGCTWVGTVGTLEEHVTTCKFTLLPCPKECKDDSDKVKQFARKDLDKHLEEDCPNRDYSCEHCGEKGTYVSIQVHDETCEKKEVTCSSDGCSEKMQRQNIPYHIATTCEHAVILCKYVSIGCETELKRKDMAAHEQDSDVHLYIAMDKLNRIIANEQALKFRLTDFEVTKGNNESVESPPYYTSCIGYHMGIDVVPNGYGDGEGSHVSVFATFLEGDNDTELEWPFIGKITFTLLNQLEDKNHHQLTVSTIAANDIQVGGSWGYPKFITHSALGYNADKNTQFLKDDTLYFRMTVRHANHKPWLQ